MTRPKLREALQLLETLTEWVQEPERLEGAPDNRYLETLEEKLLDNPEAEYKHCVFFDVFKRAGIEDLTEPFTMKDWPKLQQAIDETYLN